MLIMFSTWSVYESFVDFADIQFLNIRKSLPLLSNLFLSQISSVTKGIKGCNKIKICLNTKDDTFLTSALAFSSSEKSIVLDSSKYQSQ